MALKAWINGDESAKEMLGRVLTERPFLLLPPFHRVPLRVGNVVEVVGPSHSAKTEILMQAAVSCILPKEWNGVHYGGLEHLVMFLDLDCRFDILRLAQLLKHRIVEANGSNSNVNWDENDVGVWEDIKKEPKIAYDEDLFSTSMRRFLYVRCYNSLEFLATLKTLCHRLQKEREAHGVSVHILMIDSIGAFYWVDRASTSLSLGGTNRKSLSLQSVSEIVVMEIQKLLLVHPMLVLATKPTILGDNYSTSGSKRKWSSQDSSDLRTVTSGSQKLSYREYMPPVWQSFVTHRILVRASDDDLANRRHQNYSIYLSEWSFPSLNFLDKLIVRDAGVFTVS
ncbi:hypothetical protein L1049_006193 [Liquidambar formosana]|uniref:RecA family profile 1 domain-containing protein n=1 Tax=Liquidambar formosana TaxID=63359 RepID=A0AAP0RF41_LIQFO